jgi:hypothetical protein
MPVTRWPKKRYRQVSGYKAMTEKSTSGTRIKTLTIIGIVVSWVTFWIFVLSPFGFVVWLGIFTYLIVKRAELRWYLFISAWLLVPSFNFLTGTIHYFTGTATLKGVGGPTTYHGIDRETRIPVTTSGCIVVGYEPLVFSTNNLAVKFWTNLLGYQRGSYTGSYPSKDEAKEILLQGDTIVVKREDRFFEFEAGHKMVKLDTAAFRKFLYWVPRLDKVKGEIVDEDCFVFYGIDNDESEFDRMIFLVDIKNEGLITQYFDY